MSFSVLAALRWKVQPGCSCGKFLNYDNPTPRSEFYAPAVVYKDPVRSFKGRDKYKRRSRVADAFENPISSVQEMVMLSTSVLKIRWTLRGNLKGGGYLTLRVTSEFTLNQISGQVTEHQEVWEVSASSLPAEAYFWASRLLLAAAESGKDASDVIKDLAKRITSDDSKNVEMYPDITGDPTKFFFQRDDGFQQDLYQIALFLAVAYLVIEFLRATL